MTDTTPDPIGEWLAAAEAATPGPWEVYNPNEGFPRPLWAIANDEFHNPSPDEEAPWIAFDAHIDTGIREDAEFIAASRNVAPAVAALADEVRALRAENERLTHRLWPGQGEGYANEVERQRGVIDVFSAAVARLRAEVAVLREREAEMVSILSGLADMWTGREAFVPVALIERSRCLLAALSGEETP